MGRKCFFPRKQFLKFMSHCHAKFIGRVMYHGFLGYSPTGAHFEKFHRGFPDGSVGQNLPTNAGEAGSIPGPGRSHVPWSD